MEEDLIKPREETSLVSDLPQSLPLPEAFKQLSPYRKDIYTLITMLLFSDYGTITIEAILTLYLIEIWDFPDFEAGLCLGIYGLMVGLLSLYTGFLPIRIGGKYALVVSSLLVALSMFAISMSPRMSMIIIPIYTTLATGVSLSDPIIIGTMSQYSPPECRLATNTLFAAANSLGYLSTSLVITVFWSIFHNNHWAYAGVFGFAGLVGVVSSALGFTLGEPTFCESKENVRAAELGVFTVLRSPSTRPFIGFILIYTVSTGFSGMILVVLPIYMLREFGDDAEWGTVLFLIGLVSLLSILGLSPYFFGTSNYSLIAYGCLIQSVAIGILSLPPTYVKCCIAGSVFGLGCVYYPRIFDYILEVAPLGHEAVYLSLAGVPGKLGLLLRGMIGGTLLSILMPAEGERHGWLLWLIISGVSLFACFFLFSCRKWVEQFPLSPKQ